jgi:hypothetical protein
MRFERDTRQRPRSPTENRITPNERHCGATPVVTTIISTAQSSIRTPLAENCRKSSTTLRSTSVAADIHAPQALKTRSMQQRSSAFDRGVSLQVMINKHQRPAEPASPAGSRQNTRSATVRANSCWRCGTRYRAPGFSAGERPIDAMRTADECTQQAPHTRSSQIRNV